MLLTIARHAQCEKNLIGVPGGAGAKLTSLGLAQCEELIDTLSASEIAVSSAHSSSHIQTRETAAIIARKWGTEHTVWQEFSSIDLGRLSGVPISVAQQTLHRDNERMQLWRDGLIPIRELQIEGMETPASFAARSLEALRRLKARSSRQGRNILVCTTSHMIFFRHLSTGVDILSDSYRSVDFDFCESFDVNLDELV